MVVAWVSPLFELVQGLVLGLALELALGLALGLELGLGLALAEAEEVLVALVLPDNTLPCN